MSPQSFRNNESGELASLDKDDRVRRTLWRYKPMLPVIDVQDNSEPSWSK